MYRSICLLLLSLFQSLILWSQAQYPRGYFRWPVDLKPEIVANLGELRPNHWHMGLDVRTNAQVNHRVYAAAAGYIAYIGIRPQSFGRFIIINHPNGLSTLYGHLNAFFPALEAYVTTQQYQQESWAMELEIPEEKFPVGKGDFIAFSGTTGGSQGPHVHFEIRDTRSGKCLNPLLFGMPLQDDVSPSIVKLAMYDRTQSSYKGSPQFFAVKNTDKGYILPRAPLVTTTAGRVSFGIQSYDRISGSPNQDGIYSATLFVDDRQLIRFIMDSISYDETRYLNAHIDYPLHYNGGPFIQHLSRLPGDLGSVYHPVGSDGVISLGDTNVHTVRIEVRDSYQNLSILNFKLQRTDGPADAGASSTAPGLVMAPGQENELIKPGFEMLLPADCLYDTVPLVYYKSNSSSSFAITGIYRVNDASMPVHDDFKVRMMPDKPVPTEWRDRIVMQRTDRKGRSVHKAEWQKEWLVADMADFGSFQAFADLSAPHINELGKGDTVNLSAARRIVFVPSDNFGIKSFRAELDGEWLRFTNDKSRAWIYIFDKRCPYGVHELTVTVEDIAGNITEKTWWFKRHPYKAPVRKKAAVKKKISKKTIAPKKKPSKKKK